MAEQVRPEVLISRLTSDNQAWRADAEARLVSLGEAAVVRARRAIQRFPRPLDALQGLVGAFGRGQSRA